MTLFTAMTTIGLLGTIAFIIMKIGKDIEWLLDDMENEDEGND